MLHLWVVPKTQYSQTKAEWLINQLAIDTNGVRNPGHLN